MNPPTVALVLLMALTCELATARSASNSLAWRQFKERHGKVYGSHEEEARRFAIFMANKELIDRHNANNSRTYDMGLNHMSDWTVEEKSLLRGASKRTTKLNESSFEELAAIIGRNGPLPDEFDWRKVKGRVSRVRDQGPCASAWAFAALGVLEGQELVQNMSSFVQLSAQEMIDCSLGNKGCWSGEPYLLLIETATTIGIEADDDYPYVGKYQPCHKDKSKFLPLKNKGYAMLPEADEEALKRAVVNYGPVAVGIFASEHFDSYIGGVYDDPDCDTLEPNHYVLVVGYGKDRRKGNYWILKNSFGPDWGEWGYFRMVRGQNMCGIASYGTIATF